MAFRFRGQGNYPVLGGEKNSKRKKTALEQNMKGEESRAKQTSTSQANEVKTRQDTGESRQQILTLY